MAGLDPVPKPIKMDLVALDGRLGGGHDNTGIPNNFDVL